VLRADLNQREIMAAWAGPVIHVTGNIADRTWTLDEAVDYSMRLLSPKGARPQSVSGSE